MDAELRNKLSSNELIYFVGKEKAKIINDDPKDPNYELYKLRGKLNSKNIRNTL